MPQGIGVALGEALLLAAGEGLQQQQPAVGAVEVPRPAVGQVIVEGVGLILLEDPDVAVRAG